MQTWFWLLILLCVWPQTELLQQKLIQQKELNEELEAEKASMERQVMSTFPPTKKKQISLFCVDGLKLHLKFMDPVSSLHPVTATDLFFHVTLCFA